MVGQYQVTDAGRGEIQRNGRAEPAEPDDQHVGCKQPLLPLDVDLGQHDLPAVTQQLVVVHRWPSVTRSCPATSRIVSIARKPARSNSAPHRVRPDRSRVRRAASHSVSSCAGAPSTTLRNASSPSAPADQSETRLTNECIEVRIADRGCTADSRRSHRTSRSQRAYQSAHTQFDFEAVLLRIAPRDGERGCGDVGCDHRGSRRVRCLIARAIAPEPVPRSSNSCVVRADARAPVRRAVRFPDAESAPPATRRVRDSRTRVARSRTPPACRRGSRAACAAATVQLVVAQASRPCA